MPTFVLSKQFSRDIKTFKMKITFLTTAYSAIGSSCRYTGRFIIDNEKIIESETGTLMTLLLPKKFITVGKSLVGSN